MQPHGTRKQLRKAARQASREASVMSVSQALLTSSRNSTIRACSAARISLRFLLVAVTYLFIMRRQSDSVDAGGTDRPSTFRARARNLAEV